MDEKNRPKDEQNGEQNPPLPGLIAAGESNRYAKGQNHPTHDQTSTPKKDRRESQPRNDRRAWKNTTIANRRLVWLTAIVAAANCLYAVLAWRQLVAMRGQLAAINKQAGIMSGQLDEMKLDSRPWVGLDDERPAIQTGPITFDANGNAQGVCLIMGKNFGKRPAYSVMPFAELMIVQETNSVNARRKELISEMESARFGPTLFPGSGRVAYQWGIGAPASKIVRNPQFGPEFLAFIVGGIAYWDQNGGYHCTTFTYRLQVPKTIKGVTFIPSPNTTIDGDWVLTSSSAN